MPEKTLKKKNYYPRVASDQSCVPKWFKNLIVLGGNELTSTSTSKHCSPHSSSETSLQTSTDSLTHSSFGSDLS